MTKLSSEKNTAKAMERKHSRRTDFCFCLNRNKKLSASFLVVEHSMVYKHTKRRDYLNVFCSLKRKNNDRQGRLGVCDLGGCFLYAPKGSKPKDANPISPFVLMDAK